jgi:hypothetical protein
VDLVAIFLAAAALGVSLASLYTTSLRGAEVWIDVLPHPRGKELGRGGATNNVPADERLQLLVVISNTGAHGGVLEDVRFARFEYRGEKPRLWAGFHSTTLMTDEHWSPHTTHVHEVPVALEAGETETRWLVGTWTYSDDETEHDRGQAPALDYAERLRGLRGIKVDIEWTYRRVAGGWRSLIPGSTGRRREIVTESTPVELDSASWVSACRATWALYLPAINVLEGRSYEDTGSLQ